MYMETLWAPNTTSYNTIVKEGIMLSDNTLIKGFPSYLTDTSIVWLTLSELSFFQLPLLKTALKEWLTRFAEVLDFGLSEKGWLLCRWWLCHYYNPSRHNCQLDHP